MSELNKQPIEVPGATVPFFTYTMGETQYFEFDTSKCGPPEPMVNAMAGLKMIDSANKKVVMINHKKPMGLLDKIGENYDIETEKMDDGRVKLIFSYKAGESENANLNDAACHG
ncbi:MAG: hypothetical protein P794_06475 [Epsilonproteobacteria bacterium (ex Lamellibrachia satsuma)]|nr:MAG: hypothetical protein P794_06475 [Epsilonproteobacteria bacterium (ex Lamellibrachia satsuma)]